MGEISRGGQNPDKNRVGTGPDRDRDGYPNFWTDRDRDRDGYPEFRDKKLGKVGVFLDFSRHF